MPKTLPVDQSRLRAFHRRMEIADLVYLADKDRVRDLRLELVRLRDGSMEYREALAEFRRAEEALSESSNAKSLADSLWQAVGAHAKRHGVLPRDLAGGDRSVV